MCVQANRHVERKRNLGGRGWTGRKIADALTVHNTPHDRGCKKNGKCVSVCVFLCECVYVMKMEKENVL